MGLLNGIVDDVLGAETGVRTAASFLSQRKIKTDKDYVFGILTRHREKANGQRKGSNTKHQYFLTSHFLKITQLSVMMTINAQTLS